MTLPATDKHDDRYPEWFVRDNSFLTLEMMQTFHRPLVELARRLLGSTGGTVLDLGCGNGALLKSIHSAVPNSIPYGIEVDSERARHAQIVLPDFAGNIHRENLLTSCEAVWTPGRRFKVALLMPGHLLSASPGRLDRLKTRLLTRCEHVVAYCYQDWLLRYGSLQSLAAAAGLVVNPVFASPLVATALLAESEA